jgi:hypothetical protein
MDVRVIKQLLGTVMEDGQHAVGAPTGPARGYAATATLSGSTRFDAIMNSLLPDVDASPRSIEAHNTSGTARTGNMLVGEK